MKAAATSLSFLGRRWGCGWIGLSLWIAGSSSSFALAARKQNSEPSFAAAVTLLDAKEYGEAESLLASLVMREPENALFWFNLGSARFNQQKTDGAATAFEKVIALASPLTPAAELSLAKCRRRQGQFAAALNLVRKCQKSEGLGSAAAAELKTLRRAVLDAAMEHYENHELEQALGGFKIASDIEADGDVTFMMGLTLMRLERPTEAKPALRRAESLARGGPAREQSRYFLERIEKQSTESAGWLFLDLGLGYNSNVFLEGASLAPTSKPAVQALFGAGAYVLKRPRHTADVSYLLYWEEALGESSGRFLSQTLRSDFTYVSEQWRLRFFPSLQYQIYGSDPFLLKGSLGGHAQRSIGKRFYGAFQYEWGKNFGQLSEYQYLDGSTHVTRASFGYSVPALDLSVIYSLLFDGSQDLVSGTTLLPLKSSSHGPGIRLSWELADKWELSGRLSYLWRNYSTLALPDAIARKDGLWSGTTRVAYRWTPSLQGFASLSAQVNRSTLHAASAVNDKNFSQVIALMGITWDILN